MASQVGAKSRTLRLVAMLHVARDLATGLSPATATGGAERSRARRIARHLVNAVRVQAQRHGVEDAVQEERRAAECVPQDAGQGRADGQHAAQRDELEERDDPTAEPLVVGGLGGDEAERRRDRRRPWNCPRAAA